MLLSRHRRFTLVLSAVGVLGAAAALAVGASYALFSSTATPQTATISAATVTLTNSGSASASDCTFSDIVPGDNLGSTCTYTVDYTGSAPAWLLLNVSTTSTAGSGGTALIDGGPFGFIPQILYTSGAGTQLFGYSTGNGPTCTTTNGVESCSSSYDNQVVNTDTSGPISGGTSYTSTISGAMNIGTDAQNNPYQGSTGTITVQAWAVQSTNNTNNAGNGGGPEYPSGPIFQSVTAPSSTSLSVDYNIAVEGDFQPYQPNPSEFTATDVTQSTPGSPDVCQYSVNGAPRYGQSPVDLGTTVGLTLVSCSGNTPGKGDVLNVTFNFGNSGSVYIYRNGADPSNLSNDDYPLSPEAYWNVTVG